MAFFVVLAGSQEGSAHAHHGCGSAHAHRHSRPDATSILDQSKYFTFGSHKDDVARIQGTPTDVNIYRASGIEVWWYGRSSVTFDLSTETIIEWNNSGGNLKVRT